MRIENDYNKPWTIACVTSSISCMTRIRIRSLNGKFLYLAVCGSTAMSNCAAEINETSRTLSRLHLLSSWQSVWSVGNLDCASAGSAQRHFSLHSLNLVPVQPWFNHLNYHINTLNTSALRSRQDCQTPRISPCFAAVGPASQKTSPFHLT